MLQLALWAYFKDEPRVNVSLCPKARTYFRFGANLLGVAHGHGKAQANPKDLESCMANERARDWGETRHRWWLLGHVHHRTQKETRGCLVEHFRTLAPRDAHAAFEGYGSGRDLHRIVLHREDGEVDRQIVSAAYLERSFKEVAS